MISTGSTGSTSSTSIWYTWTSSATSSSTDTWFNWNTSSATSTSSTTDTWSNWNSGGFQTYTTRIESPYERGDEERRLKALRKKQKEDKKVAEEKALQLLLDLIGEDQLKIYKETGRLFVKGNKYDYIVQKSGFIKRVEKDKITDLCVHLGNRFKYPDTDNVIALKLALETEEDIILNKANEQCSCKRPEKLPLAACM